MHSRATMKGSVVEAKRSSNNFSDRVVSRHFYFDVLDGDRVITDPEGIDFAGLAKQPSPKPSKAQGACCPRDHEQRRLSGQPFLIRDGAGPSARGFCVPAGW